jgi:hypothetical protein
VRIRHRPPVRDRRHGAANRRAAVTPDAGRRPADTIRGR